MCIVWVCALFARAPVLGPCTYLEEGLELGRYVGWELDRVLHIRIEYVSDEFWKSRIGIIRGTNVQC